MNLNGKSFLTLLDFTPDEITGLLDLAAALKAKKKAGVPHDTLRGKNIALIFEKTSTRTRCSFEVAAHDLGMHVTYLDPTGSQIGKRNPLPTRPACSAACMTASNTAASARASWKSWQNTPASPSGTA